MIRLKICQLFLFFNYYCIVILKQYLLQNSQYLLKIPNYSMVYDTSVGTSTLFDQSTANADTTFPSTDIFDRGTETLLLSTRWGKHQHFHPVIHPGHRPATRTYPPIPPTTGPLSCVRSVHGVAPGRAEEAIPVGIGIRLY